jgi:hypothetical protein
LRMSEGGCWSADGRETASPIVSFLSGFSTAIEFEVKV